MGPCALPHGMQEACAQVNHTYATSPITMSDVIVATEQPFEAHKLAKVNKEFHAETVTDSRLNESSSLNHGCGGVGILWKKSHDAVPISGIQSDRICGIRIQLSSTPRQYHV